MKLFLILLATILVSQVHGQNDPYIPKSTDVNSKTAIDTNMVIFKVEKEASFNGSFRSFLEQNLKYPKIAQKKNIQGEVTILFIVDKEGQISNVQLAEHSPQKNSYLVNEAIRVIKKSSGKWNPGMQDGEKVKSYHLQSLNFVLAD